MTATDDTVACMEWSISAQEQIDGFRREVRELKAENARLRAARDTWAENDAKLRELVRFIMHQCNDGNPRCDECIGWNDGECVALLRTHELGMGVNDG